MRFLASFLFALTVWAASLTPTRAQEEDKGFLTRTIQDALSGAGREVSIEGFEGLLSSSASFDRLTISDADGIWLTIEEVELVWNRSALLRGRLEVEKLTAARLDLPRLPVSEDTMPDAEAKPFSLPDLPVSIQIAEFGVGEINLGAPLLGEAAQLRLAASAIYSEDVLDIDLTAQRTDAKRGEFAIRANLERSDNLLDLLVRLDEGAEGIVAKLINLPDQPPVELSVEGSGPVDDFTSDIRIATDGQERLTGQVILGTQAPRRASDTPDRRIRADIGGDITALLAPRYREFFGEDLRLTLDALQEGNGALEVSSFALNAQAAELAGQVTLNADLWPTFIDISGVIANPDGTTILLPLGGEGTRVARVDLSVDYDANADNALQAAFDIAALSTAAAEVERAVLTLDGTLAGTPGTQGQFAGDLTFDANGLALTDPALAEALGKRLRGGTRISYVEGEPIEISDLSFEGLDYGLTGDMVIGSLESGFSTELDLAVDAQDLSRFSALAGREVDGRSSLALSGTVVPLSGEFDVTARGQTNDLRVGIPQADAVLAGQTELSLAAKRDETGTFVNNLVLQNSAVDLTGEAQLRTEDSRVVAQARLRDLSVVVQQYDGPITVDAVATQDPRGWSIDVETDGPYGARLTAEGLATGPEASLDFTADVPEMSRFAEGIEGAVKASGNLRQSADGWRVETTASGPYDARAALQGLLTPALDLNFDVTVPDLQPLVPQVRGPLEATGWLRQTDNGFFIDTTASGPYGARALVEGLATGPDMRLTFDISLPDVSPLVPGMSGTLAATGVVNQTPAGIAVDTNATGPYATRASARGIVTGPDAAIDFTLAMPNIGALVDRVNGPLEVTGRAAKEGSAWRIDTSASGPSGTQAQVDGLVNADGTLNLDLRGSAPLGLSRPFLAPRDLQGQATFDLSINGPAALSSVSGTIRSSGATFTAPNLRLALEGISANVTLGGNRATLDVQGRATNGGTIQAGGSVTLTPALPADISIALRSLVLIDPRLYRTSVSGDLRLAGPLTGGAQISGQVDIGETEVSVPSTGLTTIGDIPPINHIRPPADVIRTRAKAGFNGNGAGADPAADAGGPGFGLNLRVNAPGRIFVRGRGLDAELGGRLTLTGSTNRVISAGRFSLLRGRLDILGKRFDLVEGSIQFQGDLLPYIRFVSATSTASGEVRVVVEGPADQPTVSFESTPEAPQDEVLAQLLFGRNVSEISAFQALQLANAVATLVGRGGTGVISNLRQGFGLDDLDVTTTDEGATALRVGKYLTDNIYSDVTAASDGTGEVSLNLDITPSIKGKATLGSDGDSGIGIFFERDY
ncbi:MAG: translocation/assembly module TamB [Sulfitobacter sp.]|nr:translocation/assembly module TamB [Sulfitobacter sp.]